MCLYFKPPVGGSWKYADCIPSGVTLSKIKKELKKGLWYDTK